MSEDLRKELLDVRNEVALLRTTMVGLNQKFEEAKEAYRVALVRAEAKDHDWKDVWQLKYSLEQQFKTLEEKVKWRENLDYKIEEIRELFKKINKISEIVKEIGEGY